MKGFLSRRSAWSDETPTGLVSDREALFQGGAMLAFWGDSSLIVQPSSPSVY